jgi:DedD protein
VPEWLDGAGHRSRYPVHIEIPPEPVFVPMQEIQAVKPVELDVQPQVKPTEPGVQKPSNQRIQSSIHAWALQVGSFNDQSNAQVLRDRLRASGHPAYVDVLKSATKTSYRVRIGPELDRARLEKLKKKVLDEENIQAMVVKHP